MNVNHLITLCKPLGPFAPTQQSTQYNYHNHKYKMLTSIEIQKVINKYNSKISKFSKNNKYFQYECKPSYNTMQATHLLQLNNPPQNNYQHLKY